MPSLHWIGKEAVVNHHNAVPFHLLRDVPELSVGEPGAGNLIVQGDNLVALKALLPYYAGQVKCIYIDPPYNTGKEGWSYNDNVNSPIIRAWIGQVVGKEDETLDRHDRWLCLMYPRLCLLKKFLREDGAIFVSIDDNEAHQLRAIMDEIFGKKNFVAQFIWNTEGHTDNQFHVKVNHEYVVMYAAKESQLRVGYVVDPNTREQSNLWAGYAENSITKNGAGNPPSEIELPVGFPVAVDELTLARSEVPEGLVEAMKKRRLASNQLKGEFGRVQFPLRFDIMEAKDRHLTKKCRVFSGWANANKLRRFIAEGCKAIMDDDGMKMNFYISGKGVIYYHKARGEEARNIVSVLRHLGTTEKMRSELENMGIKFDYAKPKELIKYIVRVGTNETDLVLDSFAGSGTTGQAVLEINAESKSNRRFILVQMPWESEEQRRKNQNIASQITAKRVELVAKGYKSAKGETVVGVGGGFRFCQLGEALFDEKGKIRESVRFGDLARHVYFTETGEPLPREGFYAKSPVLGIQNGRAVCLLYNGILKDKSPESGNALTQSSLAKLREECAGKQVESMAVYGTSQRVSAARLKREGVEFKQIPYSISIT